MYKTVSKTLKLKDSQSITLKKADVAKTFILQVQVWKIKFYIHSYRLSSFK